MARLTTKSSSNVERARHYLTGGGVPRDDSDDELGDEDIPWEWIYEKSETSEDTNSRKRKASAAQIGPAIVGARLGAFECRIGDTVLLKADGNQAWVGIICGFEEEDNGDDEPEKMANFMWFSTSREIRNKIKKRTDDLPLELYISPSFDVNPLTSINGKATVMSKALFDAKFPSGKVLRSSPDFGKVFLCRRGCNTRTATYTEEFTWEDIYNGAEDILSLIDFVGSHTKASRKRNAASKREDDRWDDSVIPEDDEEAPKTPKKRRKLHETTPSRRKDMTPRKFLTPTHKRIVVKKPLEYTPLGTRVLSPSVLSSPFQAARSQLHVSSVPATLPCREGEFSAVYTLLENAITEGTGSCIYISGTPGTGKTATVREVVAQLNASVLAEELDDFIFVEINGMKVTDPHQSYSLLWEALRGDRVSPAHALELLEREFSHPSPRRVPCVVLMDELDQLVTKNQSVMYNFFNWPGLRHSRLIVLAVANTMDLPERTLSNKISSRLGLQRITFPGYTHDQLMSIIHSRLANVPGNIVHPDAVQFAARKVAAVSGDARRALDICRRAVEIAESETVSTAPDTPSKTGRNKSANLPGLSKPGIVTIATIKQAINEATSSPLQQFLRSLPLASKLFLAALLARVRRTGIAEVVLGDAVEEAKRLGDMSALNTIHDYLLTNEIVDEGYETGPVPGKRGAPKIVKPLDQKAPRALGVGSAAIELMEAGIVAIETRRGERIGRIRLAVADEEVRLALKDDETVTGLGFSA